MTILPTAPPSPYHKILNFRPVRMIGWCAGLAALTGAATWTHLALGETGRPYAGAEQAMIWAIYTVGYCFFMWPLWQALGDKIYNLAGPAGADKDGTQRIANAIAFCVIFGSTLIVLLLVFDYLGHASAAAASDGQSQQPAVAAEGADVLKSKAVPVFLQVTGRFLGTFGDFFGGVVNPILTFGTLVGLAVTILLQRVQIREARAEAHENRDHAQTQTFETTFFHLLNLHAENIQNLTFDPAVIPTPPQTASIQQVQKLAGVVPILPPLPQKAHGRAVFGEVLRSTLRGAWAGHSQLEVYRTLQREHNDVLGHYFRHLYQILNLVNSFAVEGDKAKQYKTRKKYTNILRAQLSAHELAVLLMNCTFRTVDDGKFKNLLVWYKFLEHLPLRDDEGELVVPGIAPDVQWILFDYFDTDDGEGRRWLSGAFGKHPVVHNYLKRQGPTWRGPLPWKATGRMPLNAASLS
jgi:hypothetical protein